MTTGKSTTSWHDKCTRGWRQDDKRAAQQQAMQEPAGISGLTKYCYNFANGSLPLCRHGPRWINLHYTGCHFSQNLMQIQCSYKFDSPICCGGQKWESQPGAPVICHALVTSSLPQGRCSPPRCALEDPQIPVFCT